MDSTARLHRLGRWLAIATLGAASACSTAHPDATHAKPGPPPATSNGGQHAPPIEPEQSAESASAGDSKNAVAEGTRGAVASAELNASQVGLEVLRDGGNAVDAGVAVAFALGVTHPSAGNIGGGGFMVIRLADGTSVAIDYREMAPGKATREMYVEKNGEVGDKGRVGALAAGIPGDVAGMALAHEKFGSLPWKRLVEPAVALARDGWALDPFHAEDLQIAAERMTESGHPQMAKLFLREDGSAFEAGDVWKQPELAVTLEMIAEKGPRSFYEGAFAKKLAKEVQGLGGIWTAKDLAKYEAKIREPLVFPYRGHEIVAMPPPSAGGVVLRQILAASEKLKLDELAWQSPEMAHLYVETLRRTYADRNLLLGDPDFVKVPTQRLLDVSYIDERVGSIDPDKATPSSEIEAGVPLPPESKQTTHFSVVDGDGNAVSNTFTLNGMFGAKVMVPGTGVILNNEMDDFTSKPGTPNMFGLVQGEQNAIVPYKRMLSSMTPTIVTKDGKLRAVLGSPGGPTITTTVAQVLMQIVDHGTPLPEAVASPRMHHQWLPDQIWTEAITPESLIEALEALGHEVKVVSWGRGRIGHANCVEVDPKSGVLRAVADVKRDGGAAVAY